MNGDVASGIEEAVDRLEADDALWVGILTGVPPVFSRRGRPEGDQRRPGRRLCNTDEAGSAGITRRERTKPIIAAVDGPALAGGTEIALACDLIVASTNATFGIPEVKRSLVAAAGGLFRLPRKLPFNVAMEMALTGDPIDAARAHHFGLVNVLCEPGEALDKARELAARIEANAPVAVRASRQVVLAAMTEDEATGWRLSAEAMAGAMGSEDSQGGPDRIHREAPAVVDGQ